MRRQHTKNRLENKVFHSLISECKDLYFSSRFKRAKGRERKNKALIWNEPSPLASKSRIGGPNR